MAMLIQEGSIEEQIKAHRAETGADQYDEVWDGVYFVSPSPGSIHQKLIAHFIVVFEATIDNPGLGQSFPSLNISDREENWAKNFRIPDASIFLNGTTAQDLESHWLGGPDFLVEVLSDDDRARDKLDFYAKVGVSEVLIVDRDPWALELYRLEEGRLGLVARVVLGSDQAVESRVIPLSFRLFRGDARPGIEAIHRADGRTWTI